MKRKIQGSKRSHTIYVPAEYIKKTGLHKGDALNYIVWGNKLVFSPEEKKEEKLREEAKFDLTGLNARAIWKVTNQIYIYGSKKVIFTFKDTKIQDHPRFSNRIIAISEFIKKVIPFYKNFEVIEEKPNKLTISQITEFDKMSFKEAMGKLYFQINLNFQNLINSIKTKDKKSLEQIHTYDLDNINQQQRYCHRILNQTGYEDFRNSMVYFHAIGLYEMIGDTLVDISQAILKTNMVIISEIIKLMGEILMLFTKYMEPFREYSIYETGKFLDERIKIQEKISKKIKNDYGEIKAFMHKILMDMTHIIDTYISREWIKQK